MIGFLLKPFLKSFLCLFACAWNEGYHARGSNSRSRSRSRSKRMDRTPLRRSSRASSSTDLPIKQDEDKWEWSTNSWWQTPQSTWSHSSAKRVDSPKNKDRRSKESDLRLPSNFRSDEFYLDKGSDRTYHCPAR